MNNLPPEVAAAVERLVKGAYEYIDAPWLKSTDEKAIVRHFLSTLTAQSERDAAEGMAVDEAWLLSIGFQVDDIEDYECKYHGVRIVASDKRYSLAMFQSCGCAWWYCTVVRVRYGKLDWPPITTRGQLIQLCAALQINITPGGAE